MSAPNNTLDKETHARILAEKIIPDSGLNDVLSHDRPKAIILAGQPGAGKGGLARRAEFELSDDVVKIDPDELRKHHPDVGAFRKALPYTWSGQTHGDASRWADELLDATVVSKKNLIFDTTLSNGQWGSELIKDLQARGYDVEVRAIAAHRLESELGVDARFGQSLDENGFGRHVPEAARDAIYSKLPGSLDTIHAQADAPIRLFSREGAELYDSRTDTRLPGVALEEAREARLKDPNITRGLRDGWKEQQT
jgi:Zeta toxin